MWRTWWTAALRSCTLVCWQLEMRSWKWTGRRWPVSVLTRWPIFWPGTLLPLYGCTETGGCLHVDHNMLTDYNQPNNGNTSWQYQCDFLGPGPSRHESPAHGDNKENWTFIHKTFYLINRKSFSILSQVQINQSRWERSLQKHWEFVLMIRVTPVVLMFVWGVVITCVQLKLVFQRWWTFSVKTSVL